MHGKKPKRRNRLQRKRPMNRGKATLKRTPLERRTPLKQGTPMKRSASPFTRMPRAWREPWLRWKKAVVAIGVCVVCGEGPKAKGAKKRDRLLDPHHVIPARYIKRYVNAMRKVLSPEDLEAKLVALLFDPRNGLCVCRDCHDAHEKAAKKIARALIPERVWAFAREIGLEHVVERLYPE